MTLLKDRNPLQRFNLLLWGPSGAGKSELLGTFARAGMMAVAELDANGLDVLKSRGFKDRHPDLDVDNLVDAEAFFNPIDDFGNPRELDGLWRMQAWLNKQARDPNIKVLALDTLTMLSTLVEPIAVKANGDRGLSKTWKYLQSTHVLTSLIQDKGVESGIVTQILSGMMRADKHVVIVAHDREKYNDAGVMTGVEPNLTGTKARANIGRLFNEVWYLSVESIPDPTIKPLDPNKRIDVRILRTKPTGMIKIAKTTLGVPDRMVNPTYDKIIKAIGS